MDVADEFHEQYVIFDQQDGVVGLCRCGDIGEAEEQSREGQDQEQQQGHASQPEGAVETDGGSGHPGRMEVVNKTPWPAILTCGPLHRMV